MPYSSTTTVRMPMGDAVRGIPGSNPTPGAPGGMRKRRKAKKAKAAPKRRKAKARAAPKRRGKGPSPKQLAARAKFVRMVKAKAKARRAVSRRK